MTNFEAAIIKVLKHEGGFVDHKSDPGGATNFGISLRFLKGLPLEEADINGDGSIDKDDIVSMNVEDAKALYKEHFWDGLKLQFIENPVIAGKILDMAVNMGISRASKIVQQVCNDAFGSKLVVDGKIGPITFLVINKVDSLKLLIALKVACAEFYRNLVERRPEMKAFINGWLKRAES